METKSPLVTITNKVIITVSAMTAASNIDRDRDRWGRQQELQCEQR